MNILEILRHQTRTSTTNGNEKGMKKEIFNKEQKEREKEIIEKYMKKRKKKQKTERKERNIAFYMWIYL